MKIITLTLEKIKRREKSIIEYLERNPHLYFSCHKFNGYDKGCLCINIEGDTIAYDYEDEVYPDTLPFVTKEYDSCRSDPSYYICKSEAEDCYDKAVLRSILLDAIKYYVASEYSLKGFSHKAVLWALHNCDDPNWFTEQEQEPVGAIENSVINGKG